MILKFITDRDYDRDRGGDRDRGYYRRESRDDRGGRDDRYDDRGGGRGDDRGHDDRSEQQMKIDGDGNSTKEIVISEESKAATEEFLSSFSFGEPKPPGEDHNNDVVPF